MGLQDGGRTTPVVAARQGKERAPPPRSEFSPLENLPEELLRFILSHLEFIESVRAQRVCRALRRAVDAFTRAREPLAVIPAMFPPSKGPSDEAILWLASRLQGVTSVNLRAQLVPCPAEQLPYGPSAPPYPTQSPPGEASMRAIADCWPGIEHLELDDMCDEGVEVIVGSMPRLLSLRLGKETLQDGDLSALAKGAPRLQRLDLATPGYPLEVVTDEGVESVVRGCPDLTDLNLSMCDCRLITGRTYEAIAAGAGALEQLALPEPRFLHPGAALTAVLDGCPRLSRIQMFVNRTPNVLRELRLQAPSADGSRAGFQQVRELSLTACMGLRDADVGFIPLAFPRLETLRLFNLRSVHDGCMQQVARGCPGLRSVDLHEARMVSDPGLFALLTDCPMLERLALEGTGATGAFVARLASDASIGARLEVLDMLGTGTGEGGGPGAGRTIPIRRGLVEALADARPCLKLRWRKGGVDDLGAGCFASPHWPLFKIPDHW